MLVVIGIESEHTHTIHRGSVVAKMKSKKNWIQGAIKRPGRMKGKSIADLQKILKDPKASKSLKSAAALAIRFKRGEFKKKKKKKT